MLLLLERLKKNQQTAERVFSPGAAADGSGAAVKGGTSTEITHRLVMQFNMNALHQVIKYWFNFNFSCIKLRFTM